MDLTLKAFISRHNIRMTADLTDCNPNMEAYDSEWSRSATHWRCQIKAGRKTLTTYFSQGPAISREPTAEDVLDCLASDAAGYGNAHSFEEWAAEYGYDPDSRKAERTFKAVVKSADKLEKLLGTPAYEQLLWHTERL